MPLSPSLCKSSVSLVKCNNRLPVKDKIVDFMINGLISRMIHVYDNGLLDLSSSEELQELMAALYWGLLDPFMSCYLLEVTILDFLYTVD